MEMLVQVSDLESDGTVTDNLATGNWTLFFTGLLLVVNRNEVERFDGWLSESSLLNNAHLTSGADQSRLVAEPGNARLSITVGSYVSRNTWPSLFKDPYSPGGLTVGAISSLSSPGPTRDDRLKPDIVAPGEYILSSLSSFVSVAPAENFIATDMVHWAMRGTSMAAPHVTGAVALLFQADPYQTSSDIKDKLIKSARLDDWTGYDVWTQERGYGKLNALEAMREITGCEKTDIGMPDSYRLYPNYPNPFNGSTIIAYDVPSRIGYKHANVSLDIYDLRGRKICCLYHGQPLPGRYRAAWDGRDENGVSMASGVYVYRLTVGEMILSRKMILIQ
jgi:subtilisin family serine protease